MEGEKPNQHVPRSVVELEGEDLVNALEDNIRGVSLDKAVGIVEEYWTNPTVCWATIYDKDHLQEQHQISGEFLREELKDNDLYVSYFGEKVVVPNRVVDWKVDMPLESYGGRYDYHRGNVEEWHKNQGLKGELDYSSLE